MTDISFWNQAITRGDPVIDSQSGDLIDIKMQAEQPRDAARCSAVRSRPTGFPWSARMADRARSGTISPATSCGRWSLTRGETLTYELAA